MTKVPGGYAVTSHDVDFCYPDRVPLTQFVHIAKKINVGLNFLLSFCATGIFRRCNGKIFEHRLRANLRPSDYEADILPLHNCILVYIMLWHSLCSFLGFSGRFCSYWQLNFPAVSCSYLPGFSSLICSYWQPNFPAVLVTCQDFLALPFLGRECKKSPSRDQEAGIFRPYLLFLARIFRP
jgi:hypothetical protein